LRGGSRPSSGGGTGRFPARFWVQALLLLLIMAVGLNPEARAEEGQGEQTVPVALVPRVGVGIEYGGLVVRRGDFSSAFKYRFLIDLLQIGNHLFFTETEGEIDWGTPGIALAYNRVRHNITIAGYRYDLGNYYVGAQFFHFCNNPFRDQGTPVRNQRDLIVYRSLHDRTVAGAYLLGLELVDKAMLVGQESRGIVFNPAKPFEFLGHFHLAVNLNRAISRQDTNLNWQFSARVRLDVLRFHNLIPYVLAGGVVLGQGQWNFIPKVETGVRLHWKNFEFTPFVQWGHTQEWLRIYRNPVDGPYLPKVIQFDSRSYLYAGGRLEFLLDKESIATRDTGAQWQIFPEVHGQADYGIYAASSYNSSTGGYKLNLDLVRWRHLSLFSYLGMSMESPPSTFAPEHVLYTLDYGLRNDWPKFFLEGFVRHAARLHVPGRDSESPNQAGMRVGTRGIRLGHYDDGLAFDKEVYFQWLNRFNVQLSLGHYFNTIRWPATWNVAVQSRWDILRFGRWGRVIPYVQGGLEWITPQKGSTYVLEYYLEPGLRLHGVMDLALFCRLQHQETIKTFKGPMENQAIFGVRALF
jgi:hypothetical protein